MGAPGGVPSTRPTPRAQEPSAAYMAVPPLAMFSLIVFLQRFPGELIFWALSLKLVTSHRINWINLDADELLKVTVFYWCSVLFLGLELRLCWAFGK